MDLQLTGKRAVVTGGSRGIGKQVARVLAAEGARVVIVARDQTRLDAAASELGASVFGLSCDTGSDSSVRDMVQAVLARMDGIDILVNCAAQASATIGTAPPPPKLPEITGDAFWSEMNVKVMGYLRCIREVVPHMPPGGRIVNISGLAARTTGSTIGSIRNVSVAAMSKNLADELGPRGISVVVVHPAITRTEGIAELLKSRAAAGGTTEDEVEGRLVTNSLGRMIESAEVADVVAFLCSPKAVSINGDAVAVGGGIRGPIFY
jgi:NAD(P)-dependent dehydrogenase (short-subunit alcohol dehydrogenase family)